MPARSARRLVVIVRRSALAQATQRTYYLDLGRLSRLQDQRDTPFTPAVHAYYGWSKPCASSQSKVAALRALSTLCGTGRAGTLWLAALGVESALPAGQSSSFCARNRLPPGLSYATLHDGLKAEGFVIYAGQGDLSQTLFRISTMGNLTSADMDRFLKCSSRCCGDASRSQRCHPLRSARTITGSG